MSSPIPLESGSDWRCLCSLPPLAIAASVMPRHAHWFSPQGKTLHITGPPLQLASRVTICIFVINFLELIFSDVSPYLWLVGLYLKQHMFTVLAQCFSTYLLCPHRVIFACLNYLTIPLPPRTNNFTKTISVYQKGSPRISNA